MGQNYVPKIYKRPPAVSLKASLCPWILRREEIKASNFIYGDLLSDTAGGLL